MSESDPFLFTDAYIKPAVILYFSMSLLVYAWVSCSGMSDSFWQPMDFRSPLPPRLLCPWNSPGKNTGVGSYSLLQGIFPTQGSNPGPALQEDSLLSEPPGKALDLYIFLQTLTCLACYASALLGYICFLQGSLLLFTLVAEWQWQHIPDLLQFTAHCSGHILVSQWTLGTYCCLDTKEEADVLNTQSPLLSLLNPG